jgi:hypothetical protein
LQFQIIGRLTTVLTIFLTVPRGSELLAAHGTLSLWAVFAPSDFFSRAPAFVLAELAADTRGEFSTAVKAVHCRTAFSSAEIHCSSDSRRKAMRLPNLRKGIG